MRSTEAGTSRLGCGWRVALTTTASSWAPAPSGSSAKMAAGRTVFISMNDDAPGKLADRDIAQLLIAQRVDHGHRVRPAVRDIELAPVRSHAHVPGTISDRYRGDDLVRCSVDHRDAGTSAVRHED